jgi:molybdopterin/thiamine biosynthesis adenylyltransferase
LILAGPKKIAIYDQNVLKVEDLGSNFFSKKEDVGKVTRVQASIDQLKRLNCNVDVQLENSDDINYM